MAQNKGVLEIDQAASSARRKRSWYSAPQITLVCLTVGFGVFLVYFPERVAYLTFICFGWTLCIAFHEAGHALFAKYSGDRFVNSYIKMNFVKYNDHMITMLNPLMLMLLQGWGIFGGLDYINQTTFEVCGRPKRALIVLGGAFSSLILVALFTLVVLFFRENMLIEGIAALDYLLVFSVLVNLMPLPYCDMFYFLIPELPEKARVLVSKALNHRLLNLLLLVLTYSVVWLLFNYINTLDLFIMETLFIPKNLVKSGLGLLPKLSN